MDGIECHRREAGALVGFPLVDLSVAVGVFLGAHESILLVVLDAIDLAVALVGEVDAGGGTVRIRVRPRVHLAVVQPRQADLQELLIGSVIFPPIDLPVFVLVDFNSNHAGAVHVAPRVENAVVVGVIFQQRQPARLLVVDGFNAPLRFGRAAAGAAID